MKSIQFTILLSVSLLLVASPAIGELPHPLDAPAINFQGRIEVGDIGYSGFSKFTFAIGNEGFITEYWSSWAETTCVEGIYNIILGRDTNDPLTDDVFRYIDAYYLRVAFSTDGTNFETLSPDQEIVTVPFAVNSDLLDGLDSPDSAFVGLTDVQIIENKILGTGTTTSYFIVSPAASAAPGNTIGTLWYDQGNDVLKYRNSTSWIELSSGAGGSTSPGGADTNVQYNDGGSFGGEAAFTWNTANDKLTITSVATTGNAMAIAANDLTAGDVLKITSTSAAITSGSLLYLESVGTASGAALHIVHESGTTHPTDTTVYIDRNNNGRALQIDVNNTTQSGVWIKSDTITSGRVMTIKAQSTANFTGQVLAVEQEDSADSGTAIYAQQGGSGKAIWGSVPPGATAGANAGWFTQSVDSDAGISTSEGGTVHIMSTGNTYSGLTVFSNQTVDQQSALVRFKTGSSGFDESVMEIENSGSGSAIMVDQNGDTGTTLSDTAGGAVHISNGSVNDGYALTIYSGMNADAQTPLFGIIAETSTFDQNLLWLRNDGIATALFIAQSGSGSGLEITSSRAGSQASSLVILNASNDAFDNPLLELGHAGQNINGPHLWLHGNTAAPAGYSTQTGVLYADTDGSLYYSSGDGTWGSINTTGDFPEVMEAVKFHTEYENGDVVVQSIIPLAIDHSAKPYENAIAGVVSDGKVKIDYTLPHNDYRIVIGIIGLVRCKVTNEGGAIMPGDKLVSSPTPGYAMKADLNKLKGWQIVGTAREPFDGEEGLIEIMVGK